MSRAYFIDIDGVLVHGNPRTLMPGTQEKLNAIGADPENQVWFFSCWAFTASDQNWLMTRFPYARGFIRKPLAEEYVYVDDRLRVDLCSQTLTDCCHVGEALPAPDYWRCTKCGLVDPSWRASP